MSGFEDINKLFFNTPTFGGSVVITDPDLPPPDMHQQFEDEGGDGSKQGNYFKPDKLKVSKPKQTAYQQQQQQQPTTSRQSQQQGPPAKQASNRAKAKQPSPKQPSPPTPKAPAPAPYTPIPQLLGALYLKRGETPIGRGSFGTVYCCLDLQTGRMLADKEYIFESSNVSQQIASAEKEIQIMKELMHPNIVQYMGCQRSGNTLNVFQEFITGGSIANFITKFGVFPEPLAREYTHQILEGLAYLHENKIVHRDIKGANCLVTGEGVVKLADFGCSKSIETIMSFGQGAATLCGTPHFMAPEVIRQQRNVGRRCDIWSLGCTVIEMITGAPPWSEIKNATACIFKIAATNEIPTIPRTCSPECADFLKRCFVRDPMKRATAKELLSHSFMFREYNEEWYTMEAEDEDE